MNTTLVPDGSNVSVSIPESSTKQINQRGAVSGGKFETTIDNLQPKRQYDYSITISRNDSGAIIDRSIYGQFTTAEKSKTFLAVVCNDLSRLYE